MGSVKVSVFGRIKPRAGNAPFQEYKLRYGDHEDQITFTAKNGKKVFRFKKIFSEDATQEQIFDVVARPVIQNIFEGYNGTIFTYGQTGSGKTHTMTGLPEWKEAGLIPRTLQEIFKMKESNTVISIAYFEIYNEHIYDLVRRKTSDYDAKDLILNESNTTSFRNLSVHVVHSAVDAMQLFHRGDKNKMVAETSSNVNSSRSHVIFSIGFEFPHPKEETISLKPVLYLVDLAGSERISKTGAPLGNPWETRNINLSLHYLEQVLIALREPGRIHIPYRNSIMTALLKNSLGGNCHTSMIATVSMSLKDIDDTLQTCRFSERIALIKNEVKLTGLAVPQKEIETLKKENELLRTQLRLLTSHQLQDQLNEEDKQKCREMVQNFIQENDIFVLPLTDVRRMEFCFKLMRNEILKNKTPETAVLSDSGSLSTLQSSSSMRAAPAPKPKMKMSNDSKLEIRKRSPLKLPKVNVGCSEAGSTEDVSVDFRKSKTSMRSQMHSKKMSHGTKYPLIEKENKPPEIQNPNENKPCEVQNTKENNPPETQNAKENNPPETQNAKENNPPEIQNPKETKKGCKKKITYADENPETSLKGSTSSFDSTSGNDSPRTKSFYLELICSDETKRKNVNLVDLKSNVTKHGVINSPNNSEGLESMNKVLSHGDHKFFDKMVSHSPKNVLQKNPSGDKSQMMANLPLTGDREVDEEILKFYESRRRFFSG